MKYIQLRGNKREIRLGILCIWICMVFFGCGTRSTAYFEQGDKEEVAESIKEIGSEQDDYMEDVKSSEKNSQICVYVCGQVRYPGVYELPQKARVHDAIDAGGGMTDRACEDYWNLAEYVEDGQKIYVPTKAEAKQEEKRKQESLEGINEEAAGVSEGKININQAGKEQLMTLSGVGESRAQCIIAYRNEHGNFSTIEEIKNVSGIGDAIFAQMKDQITV